MSKIKTEVLIKYFRHFSARLSERYNILITFSEYEFLCNLQYIRNSETISDKTVKGVLTIKGIEVIVYKSILGYKPLLTAIKEKDKGGN